MNNYKLILLKDGRNILVSNEEIKEGLSAWFELVGGGLGNTKSCKKIIAGIESLPTLTYSDEVKQILREKYGWVNVEELAQNSFEYMGCHSTVTPWEEQQFKLGYKLGFKEHQSITNKRFSLEDVEKAIDMARETSPQVFNHPEYGYENDYTEAQIIQSLQQPIQLKVDCIFDEKNNAYTIVKICTS